MRILIFLTLPILVFAFAKSGPPEISEIENISFSATNCFGVCPAYSVDFTDSGIAELRWKPYHRKIIAQHDSMFAHIIGNRFPDSILESSKILVFSAKIDVMQFESLTKLFVANKFFEMSDWRENMTDLPTFYFSAVRDSIEKTVLMYGLNPPKDMVELKNAIEKLIRKMDWKYIGESEK